jgi:pimeloyl-ACP methyl ester carboxylesterase
MAMGAGPSGFRTAAARAEYHRLYDEAVALSSVPIEQAEVQTSFGTTHVLTAGDRNKPPLVAMHGLSMSSTMWIPLLPILTASHHVRMLDRVGDLNKSCATTVVPSPSRVVEWIDQSLDALEVERAALVGLSIGSWMSAHYAMARRDRVERLALLAPVGVVSNQHMKWLAAMTFNLRLRPTLASAARSFDTFVMDASRPLLSESPWRPIAQQFIVGTPSFHFNVREPRPMKYSIDKLAASEIPALVIVPRDETLHDGPTMAQRFREQMPHAQVELVDDANHLIIIDQPNVVNELLATFLSA